MKKSLLWILGSALLISCTTQSSEPKTPAAVVPSSVAVVESQTSLQKVTQSEAIAFTGKIRNTDILVALHIDGQAVTGYVCGGDETWSTVTGWLKGTLPDKAGEAIQLNHKSGRSLTVNIPQEYITAPPQAITAPPQAITAPPQALRPVGNAQAVGILSTPEKTTYQVTLDFSAADNASGLYRHQQAEVDVGVIVTNDGYATGVVMDSQSKEPQSQTRLKEDLQPQKCIQVQAGELTLSMAALHAQNACE